MAAMFLSWIASRLTVELVVRAYQVEMPLKIREWTCSDCKTVHARDINATKNILSFGTAGSAEIYKARGAV
jgi:transposase